MLASFYTKYNVVHFLVNTTSLLTALIPKLPQLHGVRLFGINKYWAGGWQLSECCQWLQPASDRGPYEWWAQCTETMNREEPADTTIQISDDLLTAKIFHLAT